MKGVKKTVFKQFDPFPSLTSIQRRKAEDLLSKTGVVWDDSGKLEIDSSIIDGSDIKTILKYHFGKKKDIIPTGYQQFLVLLHSRGLFNLKPPGQVVADNLSNSAVSSLNKSGAGISSNSSNNPPINWISL